METLTVSTPRLVVIYEGRNITANVTPSLIEIEYTDCMEGESDSLSITLEDADRRWREAWYPQFGDTVSVELGYADAPLLPCGDFEVDEIEIDGPPDTIRIKALAAGIKRSVRTRNGRAYENTTLGSIAKTIAQRNKLTLEGSIEPVKIERVTQVYENDLTFLKRVADAYGYSFTVRGKKLCFFKRTERKAAAPTIVIRRCDVTTYRFRDKVHGVVAACAVNYFDPQTKQTKQAAVNDPQAQGNAHSADALKLNTRAENEQQARLQADAALDKANEDQTGGTLTLPGQVKLMSGVNVRLADFGALDGKYTITRASHRVSRNSGYGTDVDLKRVRDPALGASQ
ncbi:MAG: Cro/Cl family transcriptional regulator [Candidatus Accumulibacter sp.]|jgi:phage protein D|nr:Cro/Cl family transcriptional regulator [Accumulibacter sp.]